ncbi:hypothetical protein EDD18DRAFT_1115903 [Armillaria luteobubalina]|uniref:Uncharacterized protein n=1 Tax=Armillaria luteobubalina TaxID=153913 RepID=A0AA39UAW5_9AGAR|nr:hypothetical protein EDD18DRAFT_1115903 [Armillaria luteobubalina]
MIRDTDLNLPQPQVLAIREDVEDLRGGRSSPGPGGRSTLPLHGLPLPQQRHVELPPSLVTNVFFARNAFDRIDVPAQSIAGPEVSTPDAVEQARGRVARTLGYAQCCCIFTAKQKKYGRADLTDHPGTCDFATLMKGVPNNLGCLGHLSEKI